MSQKEQRMNGQLKPEQPESEMLPQPKRRRYSREYKRRILAEAARCQRGELGALLRREGLYHSTLSLWRKQQAECKLDGRAAQRKEEAAAQARELKRLARENARLQKELAKAEAIIAVQKTLRPAGDPRRGGEEQMTALVSDLAEGTGVSGACRAQQQALP